MDIFNPCNTFWYYNQRLKFIYLSYASAVHYIIVWFDYIVANIVTVIPHRAHRWDTWKSGCDRLVSEPTLSELNTILMCLISVTQLHILESRQEHRTNSNCYSSLSFYCLLLFKVLKVGNMPPAIRRGRGGRGKGTIITHNDHEAGPSNMRAPSSTRSEEPQRLRRNLFEPARHSTSHSSTPS